MVIIVRVLMKWSFGMLLSWVGDVVSDGMDLV